MDGYSPNYNIVHKTKNKNESGSQIYGSGYKTPCVSLESRKVPLCRKPRYGQTPRRICPSMKPEIPAEQFPCMRDETKVRNKPLKKRESNLYSEKCTPARVVGIPCGTSNPDDENLANFKGKIFALEKTISKTQWRDEEGYHSASVTMSQLYRPDDTTKSICGSEKRRNYLRAKLKEIMGEAKPIPECSYPESGEAKPEPEMIAAALLMSERKLNDLEKARPDNVFHELFSSSSPDRSVALASAAPEPMSDVVVPLTVDGRKPAPLDVPNVEKMIEKSRGIAAPNPCVFQQSDTYEDFSEHLQEDITARSPTVLDVSGYVGAPIAIQGGSNIDNEYWDERILDYIIKPEPPSYRNRIRLNGSVRPSWFPGYVVVSPTIPDFVKISQNPGEALRDSWCLCRPRHFDDMSKSIVD